MTVEELFLSIDDEFTQNFRKSHQREIEDIICFHLNWSWSELHLNKNHLIPQKKNHEIKEDIEALRLGKPVAYILGEKFFYKYNFTVNPSVLIPRPETELLVEAVLSVIGEGSHNVMDLGAGSGCIGLSIAKEKPNSMVTLVEASNAALVVCKKNAELLQVPNCKFIHHEIDAKPLIISNLLDTVDLIVSNPPYIAEGDSRVEKSVHKYEPHQALYGKENGLFWIHKFLLWGYDYLRKDGLFVFEFGQGQEGALLQLIEQTNYQFVEFIKDYSGTQRFMKLLK